MIRSAAACWNSVRFGWFSSVRADGLPIELPVRLGARGAHRRALAGIQDAELDAGAVRGARHGAAQGIDLPHQMALADAADGGVAAHLPSVSMLWVSSSVRAPMRAAASAASVPAWPPPTTITSKTVLGKAWNPNRFKGL